MDLMDFQEIKVPLVKQEVQVFLDYLEKKVLLGTGVKKVLLVFQAILELQVSEEIEVALEHLDFLDKRDRKESQLLVQEVEMDYQELMGDLVKKEREDIQEQEEPLVMLKKELQVHRDNQESRDQKD